MSCAAGLLCGVCLLHPTADLPWRIHPSVESNNKDNDGMVRGWLLTCPVSPHAWLTFHQMAFIPQAVYCPLIFFVKLAILLQFLNIFAPTHNGKTYWICHFLIWINLAFYTAGMFCAIFVCTPRAKFWNPMYVPSRSACCTKPCGTATR